MNKITCIKCPVGKEPEEIEIENSLEAMQEQVGGYIEVLPLQEQFCSSGERIEQEGEDGE